jgi:hypothetical protein
LFPWYPPPKSPYALLLAFQADNSIEKNLARRQLIVKSNESSSWFIEIKYILRKYNLQGARWYLDNPPKKSVVFVLTFFSEIVQVVSEV